MANTCPSGPEFKEAVRIFGQFNTYKFYYDHNERLGSVDEMKDYLIAQGKYKPDVEMDAIREETAKKFEQYTGINELTEETADQLIQFLNTKFPGLKGRVIKDRRRKWKAHIVKGEPVINLAHAEISDGFHEYSHPFLMSLRLSNRELFQQLWNDLQQTPEYAEILERAKVRVDMLYPEYRGKAEKYAEEVMATALGFASELHIEGKQKRFSKNMKAWLEDIFKWLNKFFSEIFATKVHADRINKNTTFGDIVNMFTDVRTQILLNQDWAKVDEILSEMEDQGKLPRMELEGMDNEIANALSTALVMDGEIVNPSESIAKWFEKTYKIPKRKYKPRNIEEGQVVNRIASQIMLSGMTKAGQIRYELTGAELKQLPETTNKSVPALTVTDATKTKDWAKAKDVIINSLEAIPLRYRYAENLYAKGDTRIGTNNMRFGQLTNEEAEIVGEFQDWFNETYPTTKSLPASELADQYIDWVTDMYGLKWTMAGRSHDNFGISSATHATVADEYDRVMFYDDFIPTGQNVGNFHSFFLKDDPKGDKAGTVGALGWFVRAVIGGDRWDHEFQSDVIPEIHDFITGKSERDFLLMNELFHLENQDPFDKARQQALGITKRMAATKLDAARSFRNEQPLNITNLYRAVVYNGVDPESFTEEQWEAAARAISSEFKVKAETTVKVESPLTKKIQNWAFNILLGRKSKRKDELQDWMDTFEIEKVKEDEYKDVKLFKVQKVRLRRTRQGPVEETFEVNQDWLDDELPFSKVLDTKHPIARIKYGAQIFVVKLTAKTLNTMPEYIKKQMTTHNNWVSSTSPVKIHGKVRNEFDMASSFVKDVFPVLIGKDGVIRSPHASTVRPKVLAIIKHNKETIDNIFKSYRSYKKQRRAAQTKEEIFKEVENIKQAFKYYREQYLRYVDYFDGLADWAAERRLEGADIQSIEEKKKERIAKLPEAEKIEIAEAEERKQRRYKRYSALYKRWWDIVIHQSINSAKAEGRSFYYLPTAASMFAIEGNEMARPIYITPDEVKPGGHMLTNKGVLKEYFKLSNINEEVKQDILDNLTPDETQRLQDDWNRGTTSIDGVIWHLDSFTSPMFEDFKKKNQVKRETVGPFFKTLSKIAKKNNIKLSIEQPQWSRYPLIKVDLTGYTISHPYRFSKLDQYKDNAIKLIENVLGSVYNNNATNTRQHDIDYLNSRLQTMDNGGDNPWQMVKSSKGNWYLAGYKNRPVLSDDYWSPYGEARTSYYIDDTGLTDIEKEQLGTLSQFSIKPEEMEPSFENIDRTQSADIVTRLFRLLPKQMGVGAKIIDEAQAVELTKDTKNPYKPGSGQRAFFFGGNVYFVGENLSIEMLFHEFSHPLIAALRADNLELFNKLYDKLMTTEEGKYLEELVKARYKDDVAVDTTSEEFREEVMVFALSRQAEYLLANERTPTTFREFIKDLMYRIRQFFRKVFGQKVDISKLEATTTLEDLAKMVAKGERFKLDQEIITREDVAQYLIDTSEYIEDMMRLTSKDLTALATKGYDIAIRQIEIVRKNKNFNEMRKVLVDEFGRGHLYELKGQFGKYTNALDKELMKFKDELEIEKGRAEAMVNSLLRLEYMVEKVVEHMTRMKNEENPDDRDNLMKAYHYNYFLNYWRDFIRETQADMNAVEIPADNPLSTLVGRLEKKMEKAKSLTNDLNKYGLRDILHEVLLPMSEALEQKYKERIKDRKDKNQPQNIIDTEFVEFYGMKEEQWKEYNRLKKLDKRTPEESKLYTYLHEKSFDGVRLTAEKIDKTLEGDLGDANYANSFFEGYMYNTDPVVGGFATYVKNNMSDVLNKAHHRYNDIMMDIEKELEDIGYNPTRTADLASKIAFLDKTGRYDRETNTLDKVEVLTFLNQHKDYRHDIDEANVKVEETHREWVETGTDEAEKAYNEALEERRQLRRDFFYQEYVQEIYDKDKLLIRDKEDSIGIMAASKRNEILEKIRDLQSKAINETDNLLIEAQITEMWSDYRQLHSRFTLKNKLKKDFYIDAEGNKVWTYELSIAERLTEYRNKTSKYYEWVYRTGSFENALKAKEQELINRGLVPNDDGRFEEARDIWIKKNTQIKLKQSFYDEKRRIMDQISEIMRRIYGKMTREDLDMFRELRQKKREGNLTTEEEKRKYVELRKVHARETNYAIFWEDLLEIAYNYRDESGQVAASNMSEDAIKEVKSLQEKIEIARKKLTRGSGLNYYEQAKLDWLYKERNDRPGGLTIDEVDELDALLDKQELEGLGPVLKDKLNALYAELAELQRSEATEDYCNVINEWVSELQLDITDIVGESNYVTEQNADLLLDTEVVEQLMEDEEFADWFTRNHIKKQRFDPGSKSMVSYWERLYVWNNIRPRDERYYETTKIGEEGEAIMGVPVNKFWMRVVKKEFRTEKIVGKTVDNRGTFLPKSREDMEKYREENPDRFDEPGDHLKYINERYFELKDAYDENPRSEKGKIFALLQKMSTHHLENQQGLGRKAKLYMDIPRYRLKTLEVLQAKQAQKSLKTKGGKMFPVFSQMLEVLRVLMYKQKDDIGEGYNKEDSMTRMERKELDMLTDLETKRKLDKDEKRKKKKLLRKRNAFNNFNLISTDLFDNEISDIHVSGLYDIDNEFVSKDIIHSMMRYMLSAERQKKLIEMNPVARALQMNLEETKPLDLTSDGLKKVNRGNYLNRMMISYLRKKGKTVRGFAVNNLIEREFEYQSNAGWLSDNKFWNTFSQAVFQRAAFGYFAFNATSALKNLIGPKWQAMIETSAGKHMSLGSLARGEGYAMAAMTQVSMNVYTKGPKPLLVQMGYAFDAVQGDFEEKIGESPGRTLLHDVVNMSWVYNFRKWTESEATMHLFFGMMEHQKIPMGDKKISYTKAWELQDGQMVLKKGIDVRYGNNPIIHEITLEQNYKDLAGSYNIPQDEFEEKILSEKDFNRIQADILRSQEERKKDLDKARTEEEVERINAKYDREIDSVNKIKIDNIFFKTIKNRIHQAQNNLQGAYSRFDQPEAQRYLAFRWISFLRRFFIPMFVNRWGFSGSFMNPRGRYNPGFSDNPMGFYVASMRAMMRTFTVDARYLMYATKEEKRAIMKTIFEYGALLAISWFLLPFLGWDSDDDDKYEKLRQMSGPLPMPGVAPGQEEFDMLGFLNVHLINLAMQVRAENETMTPWPGMGMIDYTQLTDLKLLATGPTLKSYAKLFSQGWDDLFGDTEYYERRVGPYRWQQKDTGQKFWNTWWKMFGLTGTQVAPYWQIKGQEGYRKTQHKIR